MDRNDIAAVEQHGGWRVEERDGKGLALGRPFLLEIVTLCSLIALTIFLVAGPVEVQVWRLFTHLLTRFLLICGLSLLIIGGVRLLRSRGNPGGPTSEPMRFSRVLWIDAARIVAGFSVVETSHLVLKAFLPAVRKENFDAILARIDIVLLGGHPAITLVQGLGRHPLILKWLDSLYSGLYFFIVWGSAVAFFVVLSRRERLAFFGSFALFWQIGLVLYFSVLAWGPVFVQPEAFRSLLAHMPHTTHVQLQLVRETSSIVHGDYDLAIRYYGLAAFPSLHVGVVLFFLLWSRHVSRRWVVFFLALFPLITLGSLVTGYHYFVDALGGVTVALAAYGVGVRFLGNQPK